jgi:cob(I)alamin adenosyltransferase
VARQGMLHLYMGNGKGKTTAAIGLCIRASGQGLRVVFAQFLKGGTTGERHSLAGIDNIIMLPVPSSIKFVRDMTTEEFSECRRQTMRLFRDACQLSISADLLVLDELAGAVSTGLADEAEVLAFIANRPDSLEVVITGRDPTPQLIEKADYITAMACVRHPYEKGIAARRGIEY